jgi:regulator of protease activity HflC (stomatin/prohibitin superfamily)
VQPITDQGRGGPITINYSLISDYYLLFVATYESRAFLKIQNQRYITTDGQSVILSWYWAIDWNTRSIFLYGTPSSGALRRVALVRTDISEELIASIMRMTRIGELGTTLAVTSN